MTFYIEHIKIELTEDLHGLRLRAMDTVWPLPRQSPEEAKGLIVSNFAIVKARYAKAALNLISTEELSEVSLQIVLDYFYLYNSWKGLYEKEKNRDLAFQQKDFTHPYTYNTIIRFFKKKYPDDYAHRCAAMFGMTSDAVLNYEAGQRDFYDALR